MNIITKHPYLVFALSLFNGQVKRLQTVVA
jgi:hypothetical protein